MIDAKQIMIGNWFSHNENWNCADHKGYFQFTESDWYAIGECTLFLEDADYVPLSEEILLKSGFEKGRYDSYFITLENEYSKLTYYTKWKHLELNTIKGTKWGQVKCEYLHELQQLYKILTKQELEVKL